MWHICTHKASAFTPPPSLSPPLASFSVDNKGPYNLIKQEKKNHTIISEAVYCIVNRFNSRVQLLRTKQRRFFKGSAGMCWLLLAQPSNVS